MGCVLTSPQANLSVPASCGRMLRVPGAQTSNVSHHWIDDNEEVWNAQEHRQVRPRLEDGQKVLFFVCIQIGQ